MAKSIKRYFWLKLKDNFFNQKEVKKLRRVAGGDTYTIIYLKLQLLSLKNGGRLFFEGIEENFHEEIALELDEDEENVLFTLIFLEKYGLLEKIDESEYAIPNVIENTGSESAGAERVRRFREKKKNEMLQCNTNETQMKQPCNVETETETEIEIEIEIEIEQQLEKEFSKEDIESIKKYMKNNFVDAVVVVEKLKIINSMKGINNKIGALLTAIKDDWKAPNTKNLNRFNNFKHSKMYDDEKKMKDVEYKLLGWDKDNE